MLPATIGGLWYGNPKIKIKLGMSGVYSITYGDFQKIPGTTTEHQAQTKHKK